MTIAFKLVQKNKDNRIKVFRLTRYFPDHNDLQMRQKLKVSLLSLSHLPLRVELIFVRVDRNSWSSSERETIKVTG